jgi:putative FmdB family regulatory protein
MPIYEYQCNKCKAVFDHVLLRHDEVFTPQCKKCKSTDVTKLISRTRYLSGPREDGLAEAAIEGRSKAREKEILQDDGYRKK